MPPATDGSQRRHLTLFFSDLSDSTRIAATMEPEDYAALLQQLRDLCEQIIPRHGGEIVRVDGDGVLCIFGYPVAHEDTGRRATEAALDLHNAASALDQAFASSDVRIRLHTGVHSGTVLVRPGDLVRGRFEMLGDATNVAARLCDHARADEIVVSAATLGADRPFFSTGPRRLVGISGRARDLPVYTVHGREPTANRFAARVRRGIAPFAGRAEQLDRLDALLARVRGGASHLAVVAGPAGIGKTRLAGEFLDRAARGGALVLRGYCEAYLGARPLQPFVQIVEALSDGQPRTEPAVALDSIQPVLLDLLGKTTGSGPVVIAIDDWQWADDASRNLLDAIWSHLPGPVLFLLSTRQEDPHLLAIDMVTVIAVPPLAPDEASTAIAGLVSTPDPFLIDRICSHAGGSPLFIEELCHASLEDPDTILQGDRSAWLDMLIQVRFARLPNDRADLVKAAAVIGHMIPSWLFEAVTGVGAGDLAMRDLASEDFLYEDETPGVFRFKHAITRDAIYRTVGLDQQRALHRRVVEALHARSAIDGEDPYFEALAYHHGAARDTERAAHYAVLAGDKALAASALDRAQAHYRSAVEGLSRLADEAARTKQLNRAIHRFGLACVSDPSPDQIAVLTTAAARAGATANVEGTTQCNYWLGAIAYGLGQAQASIAYITKALATIDTLANPGMVAQLTANLGQAYSAAGDYSRAENCLDSAITAMRAMLFDAMRPGFAYALASRGFVLADQGHFAEADAYYAEAESLLHDHATPLRGSVVTQQAAVGLWRGDFAQALRYAEAGAGIGQKSRSRYYVVMSSALAGFARWQSSRDATAVDDLVKAAQWFMSGASQQRTSLCFGWLAEIMAEQGDVAGTRLYAAWALMRARRGDRLGEAMACRAMARIAKRGCGPRGPDHYLALAERSAAVRMSAREHALNRELAAELKATPVAA